MKEKVFQLLPKTALSVDGVFGWCCALDLVVSWWYDHHCSDRRPHFTDHAVMNRLLPFIFIEQHRRVVISPINKHIQTHEKQFLGLISVKIKLWRNDKRFTKGRDRFEVIFLRIIYTYKRFELMKRLCWADSHKIIY